MLGHCGRFAPARKSGLSADARQAGTAMTGRAPWRAAGRLLHYPKRRAFLRSTPQEHRAGAEAEQPIILPHAGVASYTRPLRARVGPVANHTAHTQDGSEMTVTQASKALNGGLRGIYHARVVIHEEPRKPLARMRA